MDKKQFDELMRRLDIAIKLLASNSVQGKGLTEQVLTLYSAGLETGDIAQILGKDQHLVSQTLYQAKKAREKKGTK
jgi:transposase-like protein